MQEEERSLTEMNYVAEIRDVPNLLDVLGTDCTDGRYQPSGDPNCPGIPEERTIDVTGLPDYPGCTFKVTFKQYTCRLGTLTDIAVSDYQIVSHDCQKFSGEIANSSLPDFNNTNELRETFELQMYEAIEDFIIAEELSIQVDSFYRCQKGRLFEVNHFASSCYKYCYDLYQYDGEIPLWNQIKIGGCGTECCEVHTRICVEKDGTINKETDYVDCVGAGCLHCQYDPTFWEWSIHPCDVPGTIEGISVYDDQDPNTTTRVVTDCIFDCKVID